LVTDYRAPAYYEARELRQQGLSGKQIAEQLGVSLKTVYDWVSDIELTAEQHRALKSRKAMRKSSAPSTIAVREEAKQLRQQGLSVKAIAKQLDVAQSSVSIWVRAIELTPEMQARIRENGQRHIAEAGHKGSQANIAKFRQARENYQQEGRLKARSGDHLHVSGCMLYWAEGTKSRSNLTFVNSDPAMIVFFARFLRQSLSVSDEAIAIRAICYLNNGLTLEQIETHWLDLLQLPRTCLRRATVNVQPKSSQQKGRKLPYGLCALSVYDFRVLHHIYGAIQEYIGIDKPEWLE
jgi:transposase